MSDEPTRGKNLGCPDRVCAACPWRVENHDKPHPDDWYSKENLFRLWTGLREGERMTCHPTDPKNPAATAGPAAAPDGADFHECAGAHAILQRELVLYEEVGCDYDAYVAATEAPAVTLVGLASYAEWVTFIGTSWGSPVPVPALDAEAEGVAR